MRYKTAPEAQGRRPAILGLRGRQPSSDALYGHLRARDGQGPIASLRHTSLLRASQVRRGSSKERLHRGFEFGFREKAKLELLGDPSGVFKLAGGVGVHVGNSGFDSYNVGPMVLRVNSYFAEAA